MTEGRAAAHGLEDLLAGCAVVMAHPDDEVLWASSVLARAARILLCFGDLASWPQLGEGRRRALASFPLDTVEFLDLAEAGVFDRADWSAPRPVAAGLALRPQVLSDPPRAAEAYAENHARLCTELTARLAGVAQVVTHNPWGEYGHEEHVQVLRAVCAAQAVHGFEIWVTNYAAPKSMRLMLAERHRLVEVTPPLPTDRALAARAQALYTAEGCWTWDDVHAWPETERFFRLGPADPPQHPLPMTALPLNIVPRDGAPQPGLAALTRRLRRRLRLRSRLTGRGRR